MRLSCIFFSKEQKSLFPNAIYDLKFADNKTVLYAYLPTNQKVKIALLKKSYLKIMFIIVPCTF